MIEKIRIAVAGVGGRMGRKLIQAVKESKQVVLGAALARAALRGIDAGELAGISAIGVPISDSLTEVKDAFDILMDFTQQEATMKNLEVCSNYNKGVIIGTTGLSDAQKAVIRASALHTGIVLAANFSVGGNLMFKLLEKVAQVLVWEKDIEIMEVHHRNKVDAPSGTALAMGEAIAGSLGRDIASCAVYGSELHTGSRKAKSIGLTAVRAGEIVGEHTALFVDRGESIEITHKASSRITFAYGAISATLWLGREKIGLYDMLDVIGLENGKLVLGQ